MIAYDIFSYSDTGWFMNALSFFNSTDNKIMVTIVLVAALIVIIELVALWGIFTKAKKPGFISLIPIYNIISLLNLAKLKAYHFILLCIPVVGLYSWYRLSMNLAQVFKKKPSFGWGLFFLNPIFIVILGFGDSEYDKNYYYTEVEETPPTKTVIAPNRMVFEDYNQGLIFDPSQNVDDVVTAAPITNDTVEMFESDMNKEGINMAFQDMSEAAMNNANGVGGVPELGTPQIDTGMEVPTPEPPKSYSATPNQFFMPEASQEANLTPVPTMTSPNTESKFGAEPAKMTVEQLLGIQSTTDSEPPKPTVEQSTINAENVFGVQLQEEPTTPVAPVAESSNQSASADTFMTAPLDTTMPAPTVAPMNAQPNTPSQSETVSQDINQILGVNPNELQAVPLTQQASEVSKPESESTMPIQNDVAPVADGFNDDISKILGINPNELEEVPLVPAAPVVPEINIPGVVTANSENTPVTETTLASSIPDGNLEESQQVPVSQEPKDAPTAPTDIDINSLLGLDNTPSVPAQQTIEPEPAILPQPETREVTNITDTSTAMINNAEAAAETMPVTSQTQNNFNLDNFLSNNQIDANPNAQVTNTPVGQIQSFVGQPEPLDSMHPQTATDNSFIEKEEVPAITNDKKCPNCGAKLPSEAKFCYLCGKAL